MSKRFANLNIFTLIPLYGVVCITIIFTILVAYPTSPSSYLCIQQVDHNNWLIRMHDGAWHRITWSIHDPDWNSSSVYFDGFRHFSVQNPAGCYATFRGDPYELTLYLNGTFPIWSVDA